MAPVIVIPTVTTIINAIVEQVGPIGTGITFTNENTTVTITETSIVSEDEDGRSGIYTTPASYSGTAGNDHLVFAPEGTGSGNVTFSGLAGDDYLAGNVSNALYASNATIDGGEGNDSIFGGFGNDSLSGGAGDDIYRMTATTASGIDTFVGGDGTDTLSFNTSAASVTNLVVNIDVANGRAVWGADWSPDNPHSTLVIGSGVEVFEGGDAADTITGGTGNDILIGDGGDDIIDGGEGKDTIHGGAGDDTLDGGAGDDSLETDATSNDEIHGGDGQDILNIANTDGGWTEITAGEKVEFYDSGENLTGTTTFDGIETYHLGLGVDTFTGSSGADTVVFGGGNDDINGSGGDDYFYASLLKNGDAVYISGGTGHDTLSFEAVQTTFGVNLINDAETGTFSINLGSEVGTATGSFDGIENFRLTYGADTYTGGNNEASVTVCGLGGNDTYTLGNDSETILFTGSGESTEQLFRIMGTDILNNFSNNDDRIMIDTSVFGEDVELYYLYNVDDGIGAAVQDANIADTNAAIFVYYDEELLKYAYTYSENAAATTDENSYTFAKSGVCVSEGNIIDQTGGQIAVAEGFEMQH